MGNGFRSLDVFVEVWMGNGIMDLNEIVMVQSYRAVGHDMMPHSCVGDLLFVVGELSEHFLELCNGLIDGLAFTTTFDIINVFG